MLNKLTARNFRVYKKKSFSFHKHVTVIIGPNDRGKSTIVNLLRWIMLNRPSGKTVIRRGSKEVVGILSIDGTSIRKTLRGSSSYVVGRKTYRAFGTRLPQSVERVANVSELSFQRQHESSFWLALSPGHVAKELNSIVDLKAIDTVQASLAKQIRETSVKIRVTEERLREARKLRRALAWVRQFDVAISRAELSANRYRAKSHRMLCIASALKMALSADDTRKRLSAGLSIAHRATLAGQQLRAVSNRLAGLRAVYGAVRSAQSQIETPPQHSTAGQQALTIQPQITWLAKLIDNAEHQQKELVKCQRKVKTSEKKLEKGLKGRCPTCGGLLTNTMVIY